MVKCQPQPRNSMNMSLFTSNCVSRTLLQELSFLKFFLWVIDKGKDKNRLQNGPNTCRYWRNKLSCNIFVTCTILENRKAFFFFSSEAVLLHQTVIKEWLMFCWKTLTPTFILNPFLLNLEKSLIPTLLTHLRLCKMIISQRVFFFFFFFY